MAGLIESGWQSALSAVPPRQLFVGGTLLFSTLTYFIHGALYSLLDFYHVPAKLFGMKIQPKRQVTAEVRHVPTLIAVVRGC